MKKIVKKPITLKAHLWLYFCTFAVAIMAILWILQILFLGAFYNSMKLNELKKAGNIIKDQYSLNDENFYDFWFNHSFNSGIFAQLINENGQLYQNYTNAPANNIPPKKPDDNKPDTASSQRDRRISGYETNKHRHRDEINGYINLIGKIEENKNNEIAYIEKPDGRRGAFGVYGTYLGEADGQKIYLYLMSPLERTDTTRKVLQTQLLIASCISILLALAIAYFIAKRFSKPVERINEGAKRLARGDYNVEFDNGTYREIDELSDTLNYATKELSKTEELRRDLISNVSHDLRTPLTIINSYAELIRDISGNNDEKRTKHANVIIEEAQNLSLLVNDMLDLSRIQSGTMPMEIKKFDLLSLVDSTVKRFEYYRENHGITFETKYDAKGLVCGDERRIEQVIYNLVANAVNYTGDDKKIYLSVSDLGENMRFSVRDNGCGIDENEIDLVWDKYYRSSDNYKREKIGTGIGLSIVKNILIAHNSPFGVVSEKGMGTEFWFELKKQ